MNGQGVAGLTEKVTHDQPSVGSEWVHFLGRGESKCQVPKEGEGCICGAAGRPV